MSLFVTLHAVIFESQMLWAKKCWPSISTYSRGFLWAGGVKWQWSCRPQQFLAIWVATSSETSEIRPAILYDDMLPLVGYDWLQNEWPRMTLSDYFMSKSVFGQHFLTRSVWISKNNCVKSNKHGSKFLNRRRQQRRSMTLVYGNINYF